MRFLPTFGASRHVTLRVTSERAPAAFDALVIYDRRRGSETQSLQGQQTPFEAELADRDVTIVIRPLDATHTVVAEYEVAVAGQRRLWARSWHSTLIVLRRRRGGIVGAGFPDNHPPSAEGPAIGALAI
jgi:hypothetical protein